MTARPEELIELIRRVVREELRKSQTAALALVQDIHPHASDDDDENYSCTIRLQDTELVLNQVPVATPRMGFASIPSVNDLVLVQFINGDVHHPVITGSLYNDEDRPPVNDQ
ncbi:MAG: Rhs element Vgr protein, partial [Gammaproteobacteria bacterium]|nr:Rhs element Vgr protein [Gammaproteobacteria bacterium]